jgi:hypothetical protein
VHQHRHWRRRKERWCCTYKIKCHELKLQQFLTPLETGCSVWNRRRRVDTDFLLANCSTFHPHSELGVIPDELLTEFCCERGTTFSSATKLMKQFGTLSLEEGVHSIVKRLNIIQAAGSTNSSRTAKCTTFKNHPLIWDTGASFGLTPFRGDFLDYVECEIAVRDIARTNTVIVIGTIHFTSSNLMVTIFFFLVCPIIYLWQKYGCSVPRLTTPYTEVAVL